MKCKDLTCPHLHIWHNEVGRSSVWVETSYWVDTVVWGGSDILPQFKNAMAALQLQYPADAKQLMHMTVLVLGLLPSNFFQASFTQRSSMAVSYRKTGHLLSVDVCTMEHSHSGVGWDISPHYTHSHCNALTRLDAHLCWVCSHFWHR
jgi:hypothetical protein